MKPLVIILQIGLFGVINAQSFYGIHGVIKTPDAYTVQNGQISLAQGWGHDYFQAGFQDSLFGMWFISSNIGFHQRLDLGVRLIGIPSVLVNDSTYNYHFYIDRNFNAKYLLYQSHNWFPDVAIGGQDIIGTRIFNSTYIVASKKWQCSNSISGQMSLGWGTDLTKFILGNPQGNRLKGMFGNVTVHLRDHLTIFAEYDARDLNTGIAIRPTQWLEMKTYYLDHRVWGGSVSINFCL